MTALDDPTGAHAARDSTSTPDSAPAAAPAAKSDLAPGELDADDQTLLAAPVQWSADLVKAIHKAVHEETMRTTVGTRFLPHVRVHPRTTSVRPDLVVPVALDGGSSAAGASGAAPPPAPSTYTLTTDEGQTIRLNETWVEFALTDQQVSEIRDAPNIEYTSVLTLARRAAQYLALAQDWIINHGEIAYTVPFFSQLVRWRPGQLPSDGGLLNLTLTAQQATLAPSPYTPPLPYTLFYGPNYSSGSQTPTQQSNSPGNSTNLFISTSSPPNPTTDTPAPIIINPMSYTDPAAPAGVTWGENTFAAVAQGIATLTGNGKSGPFALILHTVPFGDLFAPVGPESLAITADRIFPLFKAGVHSTGSLLSNPPPDGTWGQSAAAWDAYTAQWNAYTAGGSKGTAPAAPATPFPTGAYTGAIVSVGGNSVEMVVGLHARTRWQQKDANGNHRFRVLHRFTLKVSDPGAIVPLVFMPGTTA